MDEWAKPRKRSWPEDQRILNVYVLPAWKNRKASEITRGDLKALFKEVSKRGPIMANRVLALLSKVYSFGLMEEIIEGNPASRIVENPKKDRERVLSDDEIRKVWTALEAEEAPVRAIYKLFLLTGQRHDEVCGMRWIELDPKRTWWTLPSERTKNGRSHRVALGPPGRALILDRTGRDETSVIPGGRFGKGHETYLYNLQKRTNAIIKRSGVRHFTIHDLRAYVLHRDAQARCLP
jgi:integrase